MNSALEASIRAVPDRTIYAVVGSVAAAAAAVAIGLSAIANVPFGAVVSYALVPFAIALMAWLIVAVARLRMVGFLPSNAEGLIPTILQPWIRSWLLVRFGLLASGLLLILAAAATAFLHGPFGRVIEALICVFWFRLFLDLRFGTAFNLGVISSRR